jgi:hypothetical protein
VNGPAKEGAQTNINAKNKPVQLQGGLHDRDKGHNGWTVENFMEEASAYILEQKSLEQATTTDRSRVASSTEMYRPAHSTEEHLLTKNEVLTLRLYSGPAFQLINSFLRELGKLGGDWRRRISCLPEFTFAATTRHIVDAMRKLAKANSTYSSVYRAVIGELPEAFRLLDIHGQITATEFAFMSTSLDEDVCTSKYMVRAYICGGSETADTIYIYAYMRLALLYS